MGMRRERRISSSEAASVQARGLLSEADWHFIGEKGGGEAPCGDNPSGEEEILEGEFCDGDWAGHSLNTAGDVDGDGLSDLLISVYRSDDVDIEAGKVALIPGHRLAPAGGRMSMADAPIQFMGEATFDYLGHGVSAGDMDGDGLNDVMLGSYGADDFAGRAYVGSTGNHQRDDHGHR